MLGWCIPEEILEEKEIGNNIRNADDAVLMAGAL